MHSCKSFWFHLKELTLAWVSLNQQETETSEQTLPPFASQANSSETLLKESPINT